MTAPKGNSIYTFADLLNGKFFESEWFLRNRKLLFVIFLLIMVKIAIGYRSAKVLREVDNLEKDIKELRANSISVSANIIKLTRPSEILDRIKKSNLGLEPSKEPPRRIYVDKNE